MSSDPSLLDFTAESDYLARCGDALHRRFGAWTAIAIFSDTAEDSGHDVDEVRARVESALGEPVFVAVILESSLSPCEPAGAERFRRRVLFDYETWIEHVEYLGGEELLGGVIHSDSRELRWSDYDYRLLVKRGIISSNTVLVGGMIFWALGNEPPPDAE